jgi:hypothetical protein
VTPGERPRTRTLAVVLGLVVVLGVACRAPGEPPAHPSVGVYRDVIRRETDSTHTALATARILISAAEKHGLPATYARVTLRSVVGDLQHVVVDLDQIRAPARAKAPQSRLMAIAHGDAILLAHLQHHWGDRVLQRQVLHQVTQHADEIDHKLASRLQS